MKKINLIEWLSRNSHEKQKPQRFARYAAMLIMLLTLGVGQMWGGGATWIGNSFIVANGTWYNGSGSGQTYSFNNRNLGTITSLTLGGEVQTYGQSDGYNNSAKLHYKIDDGSSSYITLYWFKYENNNNFFHSASGKSENDLSETTIDISGLSAGDHTISVWFEQPDGNQWDSRDSKNYVATFRIDPIVTFKANGGTGSDYTQTVTYNTATALTTCTFTRTSYAFSGWATSSGGSVAYADGANVTLTAHTDLYAKWTPEETHDVTVYYKCGTMTIKNSTTETGVGVTTTRSVSAPVIDDHTFSSWSAGSGVKTNSSTSATPISINSKGSGTYSLTANYTLVPCSLCVGSTATFATPGTKYLMSYDATKDAYYYDMASTPENLYFRFAHGATPTYYSATWNGNYPNVNSVTANGSKLDYCKVDVSGWTNKSSIHFSGLEGSAIRIWYDYQNAQVWITEDQYSVTINDGANGTVSPHGSQLAGKNSGVEITATPNTGWKFASWGNTGSTSLSSTSTNPTTVTATAAGGTVTPTYAHRFVLRGSIKADKDPAGGMAGWSATDNSSYATATISDGVMTITANLTKAKTQYKCMIRDIVDKAYKGQTGDGEIPNNTPWTLNGSNDVKFTTTCAGTYTFTYNCSNGSFKVVYPTSYTITYEVVGGTGGTMTATVSGETVGTSPGKAEAGSTVRFSASPSSGYEFTKWVDGSGSQLSTSNPYDVSSLAADKTVKAVFTPITYNSGVLKKNGGSEDGSYTVTYNATSITPSAPTKTGYHVDGYYAEAGTSTHIATAAGVLQNNKSGYTDATGHWNYAGVKDLYAKWAANTYTAENNIDGDGGSNGKYTATYDATSIAINTAPTKTGYNLTGFHAWGRGANSLANSSGTLCASQSENKTGGKTLTNSSSQWIYDGSNATIFADWSPKTYSISLDQEGGASGSTSVTMTYDASTHTVITNPSKTGYTFAGYWTGDNGTGSMVIATDGTMQANVSTYTGDGGIWKKDATCSLYAKWTANNYTVTMSTESETGYGSGAPANQTATYGADMPAITAPAGAAGYKFMGYFTEANGSGTKYYNADGTSAHTWDIASATTLHAHFQKTVISTLEHPASIAKGDVVTLDVNPVFNQTGATDYMDICWSLLYDNDNPVESGVAIERYATLEKPNQVRFTLTGLSAGYYKVKAVLKANATMFVACDAGTELSTLKSDVRIAGNSNVTILYQDASGNTIHENGSVEVARGETVDVTAPEIIGYAFDTWVLGDVLATDDALTANPISISAEYDGHLTAKYNRKNTIYFKNTLNWPAVYVNLLTEAYWASDGTGNNGKSNRNLAMTQIGTSDVWYYEYDNKSTSHYVSFTSVEQNGTGYGAEKFWGADADENKVCVVYPTRPNHDANERTAYGFNVNTPMFVPLAGQEAVEMNVTVTPTPGRAYYYNKGYWAKYEPVSKETGYTLKIFNKKNNADEPDAGNAPVLVKSVPFVFDGDMTFPVSVTVDLEAGKWYGFKLYRDKGNSSDPLSWYGNSGNMSNKHSGDFSKSELVWEFKTTLTANCGLKTNSAGDYVFTLAYGKEASKDSMQYLIGVHYPEAAGDYRLVYSDNNRTGILSTTIPFESEADTLSFFVDKTASPKLALQKCAIEYKDETSTVTWTDTIADLFSGGLPSAIKESGVYYFCINKDPKTGKKVFGDTKLYEGNFYIRTDGATPSKWDNFRQNNHLMAYSDYADLHENFTHSYTQWYDITNRKNLKFTVANDYSVSISDTLVREALEGQWAHINDYIDEKGDLNRQANVRFMYNSKTNAISRAYIDGAYEAGGNFLKILARTQDSIYAAAEGGNPLTEITFTDNGNWLYEQTVFAQPGARYKLRSLFGTTDGGKQVITQYFKGGEGETSADSATMIGGSGSSRMQIRLLYDFKTNRVVTAYQPAGTINDDLEIHADIMFMREHQGDIEQITFAEGKSISEIENIYCGLRFNKWTLNNKSKEDGHATLSPLLSRYERDIFYVSFPYDVRLSDVIGFGTYGQHWIIEYYDGAARAKNGFWIDSDSYWKFVTPSMKDTFTLKAGTGYIVALDLDELYYISEEVHASIWNNTDISDLELLFPGNVSSISNVDVTYNMPSHECKINRGTTAGNRTIKDSHWNVLGVPTFKNITGQAFGEPDEGVGSGEIEFANKAWVKDSLKLKFIYDGNLADNSLTPKAVKDFEFKAMHAYVVQYCGDVTFTTSATPAPASVAARTYAEEPIDVDFRLELNKDGVVEDQTFISMTNNEDASADFVFGEDMSKEFNSNRANIYTFIGTEWVAGNTLPLTNQTTIVPVGVKIAADGEYTFSIPEGTYGVGITLIDNEAGARVNLGLMDYTVTLAAGQIDDRFVLEISPISQISTDVEAVTGDGLQVTGARKIMIDGLLYIVKDGVVYDAQGRRL